MNIYISFRKCLTAEEVYDFSSHPVNLFIGCSGNYSSYEPDILV